MTQKSRQLLDRFQHGPVVIGDGAMGTQLYHRGAPLDAVFEYLNLLQPQLVSQVHADYAESGADLLETNTFGANALRLAGFGLEHKVCEINRSGARLAREAAGDNRWVAGSVGPLLVTKGAQQELTEESRQALFREQMTALAEGGVDCFLLETFGRLDDLNLALAVAAELGLPAIAQLAFVEGGYTGDGQTAEAAARKLTASAPAMLGANCGAGPRELLQVMQRLASATDLPLSAYPNSGFPEYVDGRHIYLATPEYFARLGRDMVAAGASLIGGCCGTGPEHIRALAEALQESRPGQRTITAEQVAVTEPRTARSAKQHFLDDWGERPIITVELDPPKGLEIGTTLDRARRLSALGVDAINLAENPLARIRMGNLALAQQIQQETDTEVIVHVTGRDRNLIGLHSDLMGAHLLGIRNILAVTGDPVAVGGETGATSVFDVNSVGLLKLLDSLNQGRNQYGAELAGNTDFLLGAAFNPNVTDLRGQLHKLEKKVAAGARFVQTQPVYDAGILMRLMQATASLETPILLGIMPLVSERNAEFLHNEVPGIVLPDSVRERMSGKARAAGVEEGLKIARELIEVGLENGVKGFYLIPPFGKVEILPELIVRIKAGL
jgi:homocysteine S-methyltransferase